VTSLVDWLADRRRLCEQGKTDRVSRLLRALVRAGAPEEHPPAAAALVHEFDAEAGKGPLMGKRPRGPLDGVDSQ
jgi:hypothetical protein